MRIVAGVEATTAHRTCVEKPRWLRQASALLRGLSTALMAVQLTLTAPQRSPGTRSGGRQPVVSCQPGGSWPLVADRRCTPLCAGPSGGDRRGLPPAKEPAPAACSCVHRCSEDGDRPSGLHLVAMPYVNADDARAARRKALLRTGRRRFSLFSQVDMPSWATTLLDKTLDLIFGQRTVACWETLTFYGACAC